MRREPKCHLGRGCLIHGFQEPAAQLLVNRAFQLMCEKNYTPAELVELRRVSNGKG